MCLEIAAFKQSRVRFITFPSAAVQLQSVGARLDGLEGGFAKLS